MDCDGGAPGAGAADIPGNSSARNIIESPICSSACIILPSGPAIRLCSVAPNAFLYKSMACAAFLQVRPGVRLCNPCRPVWTVIETSVRIVFCTLRTGRNVGRVDAFHTLGIRRSQL